MLTMVAGSDAEQHTWYSYLIEVQQTVGRKFSVI